MPREEPIYLDYQAATPMDPRVLEVVMQSAARDYANPSSDDHSLGWRARAQVEAARADVAEAFGAEAEEVYFTSGATEANNIAVIGAALGAPPERRRIIVSAIEHKSVLEAADAAKAFGYQRDLVPATRAGVVDLEALAAMLDEDVAVVSVMAVNNETGVIQPVEAVAALAHRHGAFVHSDATQGPLAMSVDLKAFGVDAASLSSHKIYGPKGVGALYLTDEAPWRPRPVMFGGGQEQGLRPGTTPTFLCQGFAAAARICAEEGAQERGRVEQLARRFADALGGLHPCVRQTIADAPRHPGSVHTMFDGLDAADLLTRLQPGVAASLGSACTSGVIGPSHVLRAMGLTDREANACIRFSLGRFSTEEEIDRAVDAVAGALRRVRHHAA